MLACAATGLGPGFVRALDIPERSSAVAALLAARGLRLLRAGAGSMLRSLLFALLWSYAASFMPHALATHLTSPTALLVSAVATHLHR
jgi:hypothetical protein